MPDVVLITMPFGPIMSPALGLSLLKSRLTAEGISSRVHYFSIRFAEITGERFYSELANARKPALRELAGEWIFSAALFRTTKSHADSYVETILRRREAWGERSWMLRPIAKRTTGQILRARSLAPRFVDRCCEEIVRERPRVVGFTSTFQQHLASLALAQRIKKALPETSIVFGGANCEGIMGAETARCFPFVDAVVSGEGDLLFPQLVRRLFDRQPIDQLCGVYTRHVAESAFAAGSFPNAPSVADLDELPYPDYSDFCEQFRASRFDREWEPSIFFESSRGCWWGQRSHCTFCGLNGTTMQYRSKSARRAIDELTELTRRHPGWDVQVTDNILDLRYFNDFIPELASRKIDCGLFYETKSNLRKEQLRALRAANIRAIQPGIESLSDAILTLMRKGVSALQNIQLLKWCKELGIEPAWNILWGFPREPTGEYERMSKLVSLLTHLPPPGSIAGIRMDRFSPNFFDAERLGFTSIEPLPSYRYIYALPAKAIANLAYYFTFQYAEPQQPRTYVIRFLRALRRWQSAHSRSDLFAADTGDALLVWDLRPAAAGPLTILRGADRALYRGCDAATTARQLATTTMSEAEVDDRLALLVDRGLMIRDGSRYLSLSIPLGDYSPSPEITERFYGLAAYLARSDRTIHLDRRRVRRSQLGRPRARIGRPCPTLSSSNFTIEGDRVVIN